MGLFIKKTLEKLKSILLKYVVRYNNPMAYWNKRWKLGLDKEKWSQKKTQMLLGLVNNVMAEHSCSSVLEVGCGAGFCQVFKRCLFLSRIKGWWQKQLDKDLVIVIVISGVVCIICLVALFLRLFGLG